MERVAQREYKDVVFDNARWAGFVHRPGDIFVCTPAKCGTTWTQTIVASLLFPEGDVPGPVTFISPWVDALFEPESVVHDRLESQDHRRFIKTHTPADGIPMFADSMYLAVFRDPRDVFMSWLNHIDHIRKDRIAAMAGVDIASLPERFRPEDIHEFFAQWLDDANMLTNFLTWWEIRHEPNVAFLHYSDLKADLEGEMRRIATVLDIEVPDALWPSVVERCTFASMKGRSDEIGDFARLFEGGANTFLFKGTNGRWRDVLSEDDLARYDERVTELLSPDARAWVEAGSLALNARP